jgi:hypothetical protein
MKLQVEAYSGYKVNERPIKFWIGNRALFVEVLDEQEKSQMLVSSRYRTQQCALDLDAGVFSRDDPRSIARSLKRSTERSRRKSDPFRSAMSMLTFYINRAGKNLSKSRRAKLEAAKEELRDMYQLGRRAA